MNNKQVLIDAEELIFSMFRRQQKSYIDVECIMLILSEAEAKLEANRDEDMPRVIFNVNVHSIEKTVRCYKNDLDLIGGRIYRKKQNIPTTASDAATNSVLHTILG